MVQGKVLDIRGAAAYLGMGVRTIYRLASSGQMPAARVGRLWRFHLDALDAWLISTSDGNVVQENSNRRNGRKTRI